MDSESEWATDSEPMRARGIIVFSKIQLVGQKYGDKKKLQQIWTNNTQHVATRWPNARNMLRPTMLRYVALACCDRLAGA